MNIRAITALLPHGLLFISDKGGGSVPYPWRDVMIQATPSCVCVRGVHEQEGTTEILVGPVDEVGLQAEPSFVGALKTANRAISFWTSDDRQLLEMAVPSHITQVRIWLSHPKWPEKVIVGLK